MWYESDHGVYYTYTSTKAIANAWEVYNFFTGLTYPWDTKSIAAMCGNFAVESGINPIIRYTSESGAFGIAQWITHKSTMISWANNRSLNPETGNAQVQYILAEFADGVDDQYLPRGDYSSVTFRKFVYNELDMTVADLARCWWNNYERSAAYQQDRERDALYYYNIFSGGPGPTPGNLPPWLYFKWKEKKKRVKRAIYI